MLNSKLLKLSLFVSMSVVLLSACDKGVYHVQSHNFKNERWSNQDTAYFEVMAEDTLSLMNFYLKLRTSTAYLYSNLWVYLQTEAPDGSVSSEAQRINIANPDGSWIGNTSGSIVNSSLVFARQHFPIKGLYKFKVVQATSLNEIENVLDLTMEVQKAE